jgi:hypothetical protein
MVAATAWLAVESQPARLSRAKAAARSAALRAEVAARSAAFAARSAMRAISAAPNADSSARSTLSSASFANRSASSDARTASRHCSSRSSVVSTSSCTTAAWLPGPASVAVYAHGFRYSDVSGIDVAGRVPKKHLGLGSRQRLRDAGVGQFLVRVTQPVTGSLRSFVFGTLGRQGRSQPFGASPRGQNLGDKFLQGVSDGGLGPDECTRLHRIRCSPSPEAVGRGSVRRTRGARGARAERKPAPVRSAKPSDSVWRPEYRLVKGNAGSWGSQAVDLSPAQGAIVEFTTAEDGLYPLVTHAFNFVGRGALGMLQAGDGDPTN